MATARTAPRVRQAGVDCRPGPLHDRRQIVSIDPDLLSDVPLFALLDEHERATLAERVETTQAPAGKALVNYNDPGDSLYIVKAGKVEIFFKNDTGERILLETARAGDFFGE